MKICGQMITKEALEHETRKGVEGVEQQEEEAQQGSNYRHSFILSITVWELWGLIDTVELFCLREVIWPFILLYYPGAGHLLPWEEERDINSPAPTPGSQCTPPQDILQPTSSSLKKGVGQLGQELSVQELGNGLTEAIKGFRESRGICNNCVDASVQINNPEASTYTGLE